LSSIQIAFYGINANGGGMFTCTTCGGGSYLSITGTCIYQGVANGVVTGTTNPGTPTVSCNVGYK